MGNINAVPVVSQVKSLVQVSAGDQPGALATQIEFSRTCPVVSQVNSAVQAAKGDMQEAKKIQEEDFVNSMENLVNALPVVGHIKGAVHYAFDQQDEGDKALKSASRSTGTILGGVVGSLAGPGGAVAGGILGGALTDGLTTAVDSAVHEKYCPSGIIQNVTSIVNDEAKSTPGAAFDLVAQIGFDALGGYGAGNNLGAMEAPSIPVSKPPSVVHESTKVQMRALVYRKKHGAGEELFSFIDPFEVEASKKFMHNMAGQYIRNAVLDAIRSAFMEELIIAKNRIEAAEKDSKELEKAEHFCNKLMNEKSRFEVQLMCEDPNRALAVSFSHMGWGEQFASEVHFYAKFSHVRIAISIEPPADENESHSVTMMYAYPLDAYNNILTWKQVARESAHIGAAHLYDIDIGQTVNVTQEAPIGVTFTDKTSGKLTKIDGNRMFLQNTEKDNLEKLASFGVWVSATCFVCDDKCYKKEECDWDEQKPISQENMEKEGKETEQGEKEEKVEKDTKGELVVVQEDAPAVAAM